MRSFYRGAAYAIAALVFVQAAAIAFGVFGLGRWVEDGGVLDKAAMESDDTPFPEVAGFIVHGINGQMVIPLVAIVLLVVSFFARIPGGVRWAATIVLLIAAQVLLGMFGHGAPFLGLLHGANALLIFSAAVFAARRVGGHHTSTGEPAAVATDPGR
ncbi:hypothetical protein AB0M43_04000 [Longispora sp. NPDC051575]|uniref:hypothetical protein n=1 Tax=Longispora sp. NPDC051575 TaxID=3154943 RepID=UPI00342EFAA7